MTGRILITGGAGLLGVRSAQILREMDYDVLVTDLASGDAPGCVKLDVRDAGAVADAVDGCVGILHLASLLSAASEVQPLEAYDVNALGTLNLLNAAKRHGQGGLTSLLMASSIAVFSSSEADEHASAEPLSVYGTTKRISELAIADYARRKNLYGAALRLPIVIVREARASAPIEQPAASGFVSSCLVRASLGLQVTIPVAPSCRLVVTSVEAAAANLVRTLLLMIAGEPVPPVIHSPGTTVCATDLAAMCRRICHDSEQVEWLIDEVTDRLVSSWPHIWRSHYAAELGLTFDDSFEEIVSDWQLGRHHGTR